MLSVIVYGRNDSYGYNLAKRAAISINCIAEVLTHVDDEILFVDCNTPDDFPTFIESIQDTLTERAQNMLRVFRLRPQLFQANNRGTHLKVHESLCRNIAIRRSNPRNRWILSTNTDMIFAPRISATSLSDALNITPDGFYELPRFELPETLWEGFDRMRPKDVISAAEQYGRSLNLNVVVHSGLEIVFDGPGDFQLMPREQIFAIFGFNEEMVLGWHVDSNLCKRLFILNGVTKSFLDQYTAFHCDHTRQATAAHSTSVANDLNTFFHDVVTPYIPSQADNWGLPHESIEEIHLRDNAYSRYVEALTHALPGLSSLWTEDDLSRETFNKGLDYDAEHVLPYLLNELAFLSPSSKLGYIGNNPNLLTLFCQALELMNFSGDILCEGRLYNLSSRPLPPRCIPVSINELESRTDIFILDGYQGGRINELSFPLIVNAFDNIIRVEHGRKKQGVPTRRMILISFQNTSFEVISQHVLDVIAAPYSNRVRQGWVKQGLFPEEGSGAQLAAHLPPPFSIRPSGQRSTALCKLVDPTDFHTTAAARILRDCFEEIDTISYFRYHQLIWEQTHVLMGLQQLDRLHNGSSVFIMASGWERILGGLVRFQARVEAQVYRDDYPLYKTFPRENLRLSILKSLDLPYQDNSFDAAVHLLTEGFQHHNAIRYSVMELLRILKPGGILVLSVQVVLSGVPETFQFTPEQIYTELVSPCGLTLVGDIDFSLAPEVFDACVDTSVNPAKRPYLLTQRKGNTLATAILFAQKNDRPPRGSSATQIEYLRAVLSLLQQGRSDTAHKMLQQVDSVLGQESYLLPIAGVLALLTRQNQLAARLFERSVDFKSQEPRAVVYQLMAQHGCENSSETHRLLQEHLNQFPFLKPELSVDRFLDFVSRSLQDAEYAALGLPERQMKLIQSGVQAEIGLRKEEAGDYYRQALTAPDASEMFKKPLQTRISFLNGTYKQELSADPISIVPLPAHISRLCTAAEYEEAGFKKLCLDLQLAPKHYHRKHWEYYFVVKGLQAAGLLRDGAKGISFGAGREVLVSYFANFGCRITATDLKPDEMARARWMETNQHADSLADLLFPQVCSPEQFFSHVDFQYADMNNIPEEFMHEQFDFSWSCCAVEHLGSIEKGKQFILNQMKCLKPGGIALHTTEFNIMSNVLTIDHSPTVLFRKRDVDDLAWQLNNEGHVVETDYDVGNSALDEYVDIPPYMQNSDSWHLRLLLDKYIITSIGLHIRKAAGKIH